MSIESNASVALVLRQLEEHPDSNFLSDLELASMVQEKHANDLDVNDKPINHAARILRYRRMYPYAVAYSAGAGAYLGMRFGNQPQDYIAF